MRFVIQGASYAPPASVEHVRVNHGCAHVLVPQEFLNGPDIGTGVK